MIAATVLQEFESHHPRVTYLPTIRCIKPVKLTYQLEYNNEKKKKISDTNTSRIKPNINFFLEEIVKLCSSLFLHSLNI